MRDTNPPPLPDQVQVFRLQQRYVLVSLAVAVTALICFVALAIRDPWAVRPGERTTHLVVAGSPTFLALAIWTYIRCYRCTIDGNGLECRSLLERETVRWNDIRLVTARASGGIFTFHSSPWKGNRLNTRFYEKREDLRNAIRARLAGIRIVEPDPTLRRIQGHLNLTHWFLWWALLTTLTRVPRMELSWAVVSLGIGLILGMLDLNETFRSFQGKPVRWFSKFLLILLFAGILGWGIVATLTGNKAYDRKAESLYPGFIGFGIPALLATARLKKMRDEKYRVYGLLPNSGSEAVHN